MEKNKKITFLFGIHNHQPVGNFGHVFKDSFEKCYTPFLDTLLDFPHIKISLHYTGPLFEWMEERSPKILDRLIKLVNRGQAEMLGGGFYEPLLSIIPPKDAVGQIITQTKYIKKTFNYDVKGIWLAERVWDPTLPTILSDAGVSYTVVDDTHFFCSGMAQKDMFGYYLTEKHGKSVSVFPINKTLRYSIPFKMTHETIDYFRSVKESGRGDCFIFADDGEKFGIWPGTQSWVYGEKWLEKFFKTLEKNSDWISMSTFSDYLKNNSPLGKVYLPMASYEEMMEWALSPEAQTRYKGALHHAQSQPWWEDLKPFVRGGIWDNFFVKYPETDFTHKKMIWLSKKIDKMPAGKKTKELATKELYKGQCNCAYWHGLFGGIYLNYLRFAIGHHLINAGKIVDMSAHKNKKWLTFEEVDIDIDSHKEVIASTPDIQVFIDPDYGGSIMGIDYREKGFPITDVISRKKEVYHRTLLEKMEENVNDAPQSIHDIKNVKEEGLEKILTYDRYQKRTFLDHFLLEDTTIDSFSRCKHQETGHFTDGSYNYTIDKNNKTVTLKRSGTILYKEKEHTLLIVKSYTFSENSPKVSVHYEITNSDDADITLWFATELNLTLLAGDSNERYYHIPGSDFKKQPLKTAGTCEKTDRFTLTDEYNSFDISLTFYEPALLWFFPIETVSQSESGIEKTYQGSTLLPSWKFSLQKKEKKQLNISLLLTDQKILS